MVGVVDAAPALKIAAEDAVVRGEHEAREEDSGRDEDDRAAGRGIDVVGEQESAGA